MDVGSGEESLRVEFMHPLRCGYVGEQTVCYLRLSMALEVMLESTKNDSNRNDESDTMSVHSLAEEIRPYCCELRDGLSSVIVLFILILKYL